MSIEQKLSNGCGMYGASMGRRGSHTADHDAVLEFGVYPVRLDEGGYDNGGAYWGTGKPLWRALAEAADGDVVEMFLRAATRADAKINVLAEYPRATFPADADSDAGLQEFVIAYLECALWCTTDYPDEPDSNSDASFQDNGFGVDDFSAEAREALEVDCKAFYAEAAEIWSEHWTDSQAGHDFWLSRHGHGTGFFDRGFAEDDQLQDRAQAYGEVYLFSRDGKVEVE